MTPRTTTFQRILAITAIAFVFLSIFLTVTRGGHDILTLVVMAVTVIVSFTYVVISAPDWREQMIRIDNLPDVERPINIVISLFVLHVADWILSKFPTNKNKKD